MKKLLPSHPWSNGRGSILLFLTLALAFLFVACGDDDSSSFVEPEKESSSSEILSSSDGTSDGNGDKSSSSVSSSSTNSSSSAKSSSSTDAKSSSSVTSSSSGTSAGSSAGNSSSSKAEDLSCTPEEEGQTFEFTLTGKKYICKNGSLIEIASSSSAAPTSSYFDMTNQFSEKVSYGEFTDPRDGQKYRTVSLYDDSFERTYVFFAENLNYGKMISGGSVQGDSTKYCYDDDPWYCENGWGGLYTWSTAMNFPAVCDSVSMYAEACSQEFVYPSGYGQPQNYVQHQGICPEGWHVVNAGEWAHLDQRTGGSVAHYMGSKVAGFGSNDYGLSILPAGYWQLGKFDLIKVSAGFYLPQQYDNEKSIARAVYVETSAFNRSGGASKIHALSIRCVKNY